MRFTDAFVLSTVLFERALISTGVFPVHNRVIYYPHVVQPSFFPPFPLSFFSPFFMRSKATTEDEAATSVHVYEKLDATLYDTLTEMTPEGTQKGTLEGNLAPLGAGNAVSKPPAVVFFTGLQNYITPEMYSDLLTRFAYHNATVYVPHNRFDQWSRFVADLKDKHDEVICMSHSSGVLPLVELVKSVKEFQKIVLLDPVHFALPQLVYKPDLRHVRQARFILAQKSYQPLPLPFIPEFFKFTEKDLLVGGDCEISVVQSESHGHCDLLNPFYSQLIRQTNLVGSMTKKEKDDLWMYYEWIVNKSFL